MVKQIKNNKNKYTHTAFMTGCDNRVPDNYREKVLLRETKIMYISNTGRRFKKLDGFEFDRYPLMRLDMKSIVLRKTT